MAAPNDILSGKTQSYRAASEALHGDTSPQDRHGDQMRMLWRCGLADLIRSDFWGLFELSGGERGAFLDAGCGTGLEAPSLARLAPGLRYYGVDISSLRLAEAASSGNAPPAHLFQSALEMLPFPDAAFDYLGSHEVIEHVEDPAVALPELYRVLRPGGVCVIATPNGASLWVEHIRQRLARLIGRRGAPVGEDHTRPPGFWRREFGRAGFIVERQMFDGAALEFLMFVAPARWMAALARALEPLRAVPIVNLLLCDRVKFRLHKPGAPPANIDEPRLVCPLCHGALSVGPEGAACASSHRFARLPSGSIDFTALAEARESGAAASAESARRSWLRKLRRLLMAAGCAAYLAFIVALLPLGLIAGRVRQPLRP